MIFLLGGKNYVVKNEKWLAFSEPWYTNLNPGEEQVIYKGWYRILLDWPSGSPSSTIHPGYILCTLEVNSEVNSECSWVSQIEFLCELQLWLLISLMDGLCLYSENTLHLVSCFKLHAYSVCKSCFSIDRLNKFTNLIK